MVTLTVGSKNEHSNGAIRHLPICYEEGVSTLASPHELEPTIRKCWWTMMNHVFPNLFHFQLNRLTRLLCTLTCWHESRPTCCKRFWTLSLVMTHDDTQKQVYYVKHVSRLCEATIFNSIDGLNNVWISVAPGSQWVNKNQKPSHLEVPHETSCLKCQAWACRALKASRPAKLTFSANAANPTTQNYPKTALIKASCK